MNILARRRETISVAGLTTFDFSASSPLGISLRIASATPNTNLLFRSSRTSELVAQVLMQCMPYDPINLLPVSWAVLPFLGPFLNISLITGSCDLDVVVYDAPPAAISGQWVMIADTRTLAIGVSNETIQDRFTGAATALTLFLACSTSGEAAVRVGDSGGTTFNQGTFLGPTGAGGGNSTTAVSSKQTELQIDLQNNSIIATNDFTTIVYASAS